MDLHAAPGGQNPWPHCGHATPNPQWGTGNTIQRTLDIIGNITAAIAAFESDPTLSNTIIGTQILVFNRP